MRCLVSVSGQVCPPAQPCVAGVPAEAIEELPHRGDCQWSPRLLNFFAYPRLLNLVLEVIAGQSPFAFELGHGSPAGLQMLVDKRIFSSLVALRHFSSAVEVAGLRTQMTGRPD